MILNVSRNNSFRKIQIWARDFLFGMMQLLDPFSYFFDAVQQWYGNAY